MIPVFIIAFVVISYWFTRPNHVRRRRNSILKEAAVLFDSIERAAVVDDDDVFHDCVENDWRYDENGVLLEDGVKITHRVPKERLRFCKWLAVQGKARFGPLRHTEANRLVVRRYLYDICRTKKVRARHIADNLDKAVAMVLIPTHEQVVEAAMNKHSVATNRISDFAHFSQPLGK